MSESIPPLPSQGQPQEAIDALEAEQIAMKFIQSRVTANTRVNAQSATLSTTGWPIYTVQGYADITEVPERKSMFSTTPAQIQRRAWTVQVHAENRKILGHSGP